MLHMLHMASRLRTGKAFPDEESELNHSKQLMIV